VAAFQIWTMDVQRHKYSAPSSIGPQFSPSWTAFKVMNFRREAGNFVLMGAVGNVYAMSHRSGTTSPVDSIS
jgi:hypothetical protein